LVATNAIGQALRRVAQDPHALVARVAKAGLLAANEPEDVIRSTFKALHDVIKAQGDAEQTERRSKEGQTAGSRSETQHHDRYSSGST
jgi:hypothetical protein